MAPADDSLQTRLKNIRAAFSAQMPGKVREVEDAWDALRNGWDPEKVELLTLLLHRLAGTAGTFGFSEVRAAARGMETELRSRTKCGMPLDWPTIEMIEGYLATLKGAAGTPEKSESLEDSIVAPLPLSIRLPSTPVKNTVFFVEHERLLRESLSLQIRYYGYEVVVLETLAGAIEASRNATPLLIIMDLSYPEGGIAVADAVARIQLNREPRIPVIFLSGRSDFEARLEAVRSGGDAYFTKPVDIGKLIDRLDVLSERRPRDPERILIVDDDPLLAEYHGAVLREAGMSTEVVTDPVRVIQSMTDFRPELILMDVYMPVCSGIELAKLIRQNETFIDIPIVFLSSETDIKRQLVAMSRGGDDFLTKPIHPEHLVASVTLRADRYRALRSFMLYDGLTGLLNHTRTKEQLDMEIARAVRQNNTALAFALIDIDHFKSVNDTYGHPVGDQVIRSLSRLLKQRLRATDTVGRFGGEEFAVILVDTDSENAMRIMGELREDFARIMHKSQSADFSTSFSCGVAVFKAGMTGSRMIDMSDKALYEAKRSGRNRVVRSSGV